MNVNKNSGFINFCFPISFTILTFLFGWPQIILYGLGLQQVENFSLVNFAILGVIIDAIILFAIGLFVDFWRKKKGFLQKKYYFKLPLLFLIISIFLFILLFIDKSCFPA